MPGLTTWLSKDKPPIVTLLPPSAKLPPTVIPAESNLNDVPPSLLVNARSLLNVRPFESTLRFDPSPPTKRLPSTFKSGLRTLGAVYGTIRTSPLSPKSNPSTIEMLLSITPVETTGGPSCESLRRANWNESIGSAK